MDDTPPPEPQGQEREPERESERNTERKVRPRLLARVGLAPLVALAVLIALAGVVLAFVPALPVVFREREFAEDVAQAARRPESLRVPDAQLRQRIQKLARERGFYLSFDNVVIEYPQPEVVRDAALAPPAKLGYTLPMELPLAGLFTLPVLAVRIVDVQKPRGKDAR